MLAHIREIVEATDLPVNADFENGYADDPDGVAENVRRCVETGVAGLSIEDNSGRGDQPLYEVEVAAERIRAAKAAIGDSGVVLTGRAECFLVGVDDIDEVIRGRDAARRASGVFQKPAVNRSILLFVVNRDDLDLFTLVVLAGGSHGAALAVLSHDDLAGNRRLSTFFHGEIEGAIVDHLIGA